MDDEKLSLLRFFRKNFKWLCGVLIDLDKNIIYKIIYNSFKILRLFTNWQILNVYILKKTFIWFFKSSK